MSGATLAYTSAEEMQGQIDNFFDNEITPTLGALATFLGLSYTTFLKYGEREEFKEVIEKARARSEAFIEKGALRGDLNATFSIFALKNRFGWKDKHDVEVDHKGTISLSALFDASAHVPVLAPTNKNNAIEAQTIP